MSALFSNSTFVVFIVSLKAKILHERYISRLQDGQASSVTGTHTHRRPSQVDCKTRLGEHYEHRPSPSPTGGVKQCQI
jgi:hypothetical protein